jgi:hypothetical protein
MTILLKAILVISPFITAIIAFYPWSINQQITRQTKVIRILLLVVMVAVAVE